MKSKNIKEFKALILRYESITIEEIQEADCNTTQLTGFGSFARCTLCKGAGINEWHEQNTCYLCVWTRICNEEVGCGGGKNKETYKKIADARDDRDVVALHLAYKNRAKYMRTVLTKLRIKQP
jgi:hypothetical protein